MATLRGQSVLVLAQMTHAEWVANSLGGHGLVVVLLGFAILVGACLVVARSRRPAVIAAYLLFVPLPLILAVFEVLKGTANSLMVVSLSDVELKQSEIAAGLAESSLLILSGILATVPAFLVIAVGLFLRTLQKPTLEVR